MKPRILINGEFGQFIDPLDRGFQYGDGLFETILVEQGCPCFLEEHLQRLQRGCEVLGFPPADEDTIEREILQLINLRQSGVVKILLSRGVGDRGFLPPENPEITRLISFSAADLAISKLLTSFDLVLCDTQLSRQPLLAGIKHLNQLERVLARSELKERVTPCEGLMLDVEGVVIEGTMSNVFIVRKGILLTPKLNNAGVSGIIRNYLINQADREGIDCRVVELALDDMKNADEIFMTNSLMPVRTVRKFSIDDTDFSKDDETYAQWALNSVLVATHNQIAEHSNNK